MSIVAVVVSVPVVTLVLLTAVGGARRDESLPVAVLGALLFPLTWVVWFVRDNHSAGRSAFFGGH